MRYWIFSIILIAQPNWLIGQDTLTSRIGKITFKSSINYYVKYQTTEFIKVGDTLYLMLDKLEPALEIHHMSSTSCVGKKITKETLNIGDSLVARVLIQIQKNDSKSDSLSVSVNTQNQLISEKPKPKSLRKLQNVTGRLTASSYSSKSSGHDQIDTRLRYTLVLNARSIKGSKWGGESYISFRHKIGDWQEVTNNLFGALKIYNLALKYNPKENVMFAVGRKVNLNVSNLGAVDGLQYEKKVKNMIYGAILGSRPDYTDYGINLKLLQAGLFAGHNWRNKKGGDINSTIAFFEQKNDFKTDRRFTYLQHTNTLIKNLMLFSSMEIDLFKKVNNTVSTTFSPSSIFLSLRYKINKQFSINSSYDALKNVIYFESFKNYIDQIIEQEVRQGLRFGINIDPLKNVSLGINGGYRFQADKKDPSRNADIYLSYYNIPGIQMNISLSGTYLSTDYLSGTLAGIRLNKSFNQDKWSLESSYRQVHYQYGNTEVPLNQRIAEMGLNMRIMKKISFSLHGEGTFDASRQYYSLYCNLMKRF